ncbi:MAG: tRNA uridine-5-carboxymethylaminomethyl(34) synthesis GTPase MnmE [Lactobacillaceae bacterium]|jgi:tRNA modification GTPase|nr:tRNA uridine-5-carboxymethylaminomethyl(34) synthesis GTPase MnmE [Lactobacillaceae bacterium]
MSKETIYALSTVYGKSGVAIIRISGGSSLDAVIKMTGLNINNIKPRYAYFLDLKDIITYETLDKCLLLYFKAPLSFTGEDVVELQVHGSKAVISSVIKNLSSIENFRMAEPGEFSKRAFYNNKMDLTEAEGLADLIDAETLEQQKYAVRQMDGNLKNLYEGWREELIKVLAHIEAYVDFPDEEIPEDITSKLLNNVFKLGSEIKQHISGDSIGERLREGFRVVIVGPPNAGKSSLLNALVKREAAIVSEIAGTTRDAIDVHLDINGYPIVFTDTAGLRETMEEIEKKGMEIALRKINDADLVLCLFDASKDNPEVFDGIKKSFKHNPIMIANKSDNLSMEQAAMLEKQGCLVISAKTNSGIDALLGKIASIIEDKFNSNSGFLITRARYREYLTEVLENLNLFSLDKQIELSAEDIRMAARALGKITGRIEVDDVLDKIFSDFCIGK